MNRITCLHHAVHVVGDNHSGHFVLSGDVEDELIDDDGGLRIQPGVGLITEKVFRIHRNGPRNPDALLHTAAALGWKARSGIRQFYPLQTFCCPACDFSIRQIAEHPQGKLYILFDGHAIKQGRPLKQHPDFPSNGFSLSHRHCREISAIVGHVTAIGFNEPNGAFRHHTLSASASSNDKIDLSALECRLNVLQDIVLPERLV